MSKPEPVQIFLQLIFYAVFAVGIAYFSTEPDHQHHDPDMALIKISFSHAGVPIRECTRLSPEEIAGLAPNMRRLTDCPRERVPVVVEVVLDGQILFQGSISPSGLSRDGVSAVYERFSVTPGRHVIHARLRDSREQQGYDYEHEQEIDLKPRQNYVLDFKPGTGGFIFL
jgi:hypothetical protein